MWGLKGLGRSDLGFIMYKAWALHAIKGLRLTVKQFGFEAFRVQGYAELNIVNEYRLCRADVVLT